MCGRGFPEASFYQPYWEGSSIEETWGVDVGVGGGPLQPPVRQVVCICASSKIRAKSQLRSAQRLRMGRAGLRGSKLASFSVSLCSLWVQNWAVHVQGPGTQHCWVSHGRNLFRSALGTCGVAGGKREPFLCDKKEGNGFLQFLVKKKKKVSPLPWVLVLSAKISMLDVTTTLSDGVSEELARAGFAPP